MALTDTTLEIARKPGPQVPTGDVVRKPALQTKRSWQAHRRVRRIWGRASVSSQILTPRLIHLALRLVNDAEVLLVLDRTRCLRGEIFTIGVRWHGRVLPVAWTSLSYPSPKRYFTQSPSAATCHRCSGCMSIVEVARGPV